MVTVVDQRGVTLSSLSEGAPGAMAGGHLRVKKEVEEYLTRKVAEVLDRSFGPGQAIVSIDVALNFDEIRRTTQDVVPVGASGRDATGVVVHKREVVQRQSRPSTLRVVDGEPNSGRKEDGQFNSTLETNYEVSRHVEQVVTSPGGIRRVSIGVVLPRAVGKDLALQIQNLVAMAAGLDVQRGDAIVVHTLDQILGEARPSASLPEGLPGPDVVSKRAATAPGPFEFAGTWRAWGPLVATAVLGLILGLMLAFVLRNGSRGRTGGVGEENESRRWALLSEIKGWIHEEKPVRAGEAKT
jgi:flagellar M-ring protein FliF